MTMTNRLLWACLAPLSLFTACDPDGDETADASAYFDDSDEIKPRCAVNGFHNVSVSLVSDGGSPNFSASASASSPTATYSNASCTDYFVIEAPNVKTIGHNYLLVLPEWKDFTLSQSQCPWSAVYYDISIYYAGAWHQRAASYATGVWDGSACQHGGQIHVYDPGNDAEKVQVAVKAKFVDGTGEHYAKVGARIVKTDILFE